jgi:hypothetical protein
MTESAEHEEYDAGFLRTIQAICVLSWGLLPVLASAWIDETLLSMALMMTGMFILSLTIFYWATSNCFPGEYKERESKKE